MRTATLKIFLLSFFAVFACAGMADAAYYIKKDKTENPAPKPAPTVKPKAPAPKKSATAATPQAPATPGLPSFYGACTEADIKTLRQLEEMTNIAIAESMNPNGGASASKEKMSTAPVNGSSVMAFYSNPENVRKVALMNLRCQDANIHAAAKTAKPKKK
jgi:hypothetical protein